MTKHRLSPSKLGLAEHCTAWARADWDYEDPPSERAARIGTLVHRMTEMLATGKSVEPLSGELEEVAEALSIVNGPLKEWIAAWRALDVPKAAELSLRMNVDSGTIREYPRRGEPGYERPNADELGGELDLVRLFPTILEVIDLKTGRPEYFTESQLRAYALLASRFYGVAAVKVAFLRALKTKVSLTDWVTFDADELDAEHGRLRRMLRALPMARPQPGEHCWSCNAKRAGACPAHQEPSFDERDQAFAF